MDIFLEIEVVSEDLIVGLACKENLVSERPIMEGVYFSCNNYLKLMLGCFIMISCMHSASVAFNLIKLAFIVMCTFLLRNGRQ